MVRFGTGTPVPFKATEIVGFAVSSVWMMSASVAAPVTVGSNANSIVQTSALFAARRLLPPATLTACDSLFAQNVEDLEVGPVLEADAVLGHFEQRPGGAALRGDGVDRLSVPGSSTATDPKLTAQSVEEPCESVTTATEGRMLNEVRSFAIPWLRLLASFVSATGVVGIDAHPQRDRAGRTERVRGRERDRRAVTNERSGHWAPAAP